jgi:hypothetical protein
VREFAHDHLLAARPRLDDLLDLQTYFTQVNVEILQDVGGDARSFLYQSEQNMFGAYVFMVEALRLLIG